MAPGDAPSEAFQALGDERRLDVLRRLRDDGVPHSFSALFEESDVDTSAGFAYHLRQLRDTYVKETDEGYVLTPAGLRIARGLAVGHPARQASRDPVALDESCPLCGGSRLVLATDDGRSSVRCRDCDETALSLSFPPGRADEDANRLPAAVDRYHRHRIASFRDGVCPECGGPARSTVDVVEDGPFAEGEPSAQSAFDCESCGAAFRCPVTLALSSHPAVVAFYYDHGVDPTDRPLWNVGDEWRERVVATDPLCVRVTVRLDDELLVLLVGADLTVVESRRTDPVTGQAGAEADAAT